ncbi:MAG: helix-turn-helix domain-containing protein [Opitutaceae bacterium]|nr:helix-turn-helix domain-containing protein [Opitutaceae bacterium]
MIAADKRKAIFLLHQEGMQVREIARRLKLSRNTVRTIITQAGAMPPGERAGKQQVDVELLRRLYQACDGWVVRMHEKLVEEHGLKITYPTLTRMLRDLAISHPREERCDRVPDQPGAEMQHDTSPYEIELLGRRTKVVASLLYLRYSKRRYLKFYRTFQRFRMKCFFHEALTFWGYAARRCIIDNTNLARLRGTGKAAVMVPEMAVFGAHYGFEFVCHEVLHSDRKGGEERSFWTTETNFLPGRSFQSLEDLNAQALEWSTVRMEHRAQTKARIVPAKAFEHEIGYLTALPAHLPAPYRVHERDTDQYGYIAFDGNYYWVPGTQRDQVKVLEYGDRLKLYRAREGVAEYPIALDGIKNAQFRPEGLPPPRHHAHNRRDRTQAEEKHLRSVGAAVGAYLDFVLPQKGIQRHQLVRKLLGLSRRMTPELFGRSIERAHKYQITDVATVERIAVLFLHQGLGELPRPEIDEAFRERAAYQEGSLTDPPDWSLYEDHE